MKNKIDAKSSITKIVQSTTSNAIISAESDSFELSARNAPLKISTSTFIKVDHATMFDNIAVVSGWTSANVEVEFENTLKSCQISRPDASAAIDLSAKGFIVVIALRSPQSHLNCNISFDGNAISLPVKFSVTADEVTASIDYFSLYSKELIEHLVKSRLLGKYLAKNCPPLPHNLRSSKRAGHIDTARTFPGFGYVAYGWAMKRSPTNFWLVSGDGQWHPLDQAVRFPRQDVADAYADTFGLYAAEAGFFCVIKNSAIDDETPLRLIATIDSGLFVVHEMVAGCGPQNPLSYAKWAFSLPTPASRFFDRLDSFEGELVEHLIAQNRSGYPDEIEVWQAGQIAAEPSVSIIVPLFGRWDFLEHQLAQFAKDTDFTSGNIQLTYVIDDPALVEPLAQTRHQLFQIYGVPFQIIWGKINRGYSGANNLGIKYARGDTVILLNSDVFPTHNGWTRQMKDALWHDESIGAVGARLNYSDGSIQHQGMCFKYSYELNVWLNEHPKRGLDIPGKMHSYDVEAATGACLAVRRNDLTKLGGLDEGFLVGDFEDSDLCLKLRNLRGRIVIAGKTCLVHLERQSFTNLGDSNFRTNVVKFNAWRHNRLWGSTIAAIKEKFES